MAHLYDSAGDDTFYGEPSQSRIVLSTGPENKAIGFDKVKAYATAGGTDDRAYLTGSANNDTFLGREIYSYLIGSGYWNYTLGFDYVEADVTSGAGTSYDVAHLYDSAGDDTFYGEPSQSRIVLSTGPENKAIAFDKVKAYATAGGADDRAYLYGSGGSDSFVGRDTLSYLIGSGFYNYVAGFDRVEADVASATGGSGVGNDKAYLYGTSGDDHFDGYPGWAQMLLSTGVTNKGIGFDKVYAYAAGATITDTAYLEDSGADDTFAGKVAYAYMTDATTYYNYASGFDDGTAHALVRVDNDSAYLYTGTPWQATGDWENLYGPLKGGGAILSDLDLEFSHWIASLAQEKASSSTADDSEAADRNALDWLLTYGWE